MMLTELSGIGPSILMVQTAENRGRNNPSSLGYCFDLALGWQFPLKFDREYRVSFANNRSEQKLLCCNAFISVMKATELWNCDNLPHVQRLSRERALLGEA